MSRFGTILREYEATAVHKVVGAEGADRAAISQLPYWMCGVDLMDLYCEQKMRERELDRVAAVASRSSRIISAIKRISRAGSIAPAFLHGKINKAHRSE
jgi:hypothetical protein